MSAHERRFGHRPTPRHLSCHRTWSCDKAWSDPPRLSEEEVISSKGSLNLNLTDLRGTNEVKVDTVSQPSYFPQIRLNVLSDGHVRKAVRKTGLRQIR